MYVFYIFVWYKESRIETASCLQQKRQELICCDFGAMKFYPDGSSTVLSQDEYTPENRSSEKETSSSNHQFSRRVAPP